MFSFDLVHVCIISRKDISPVAVKNSMKYAGKEEAFASIF